MADRIPIQQALENTGIYTAYFEIESARQAPYIVWRGRGQNNFIADDTFYFGMGNTYEVDYYFLMKSEEVENVIEQALLDAGFLYEKGEDLRDSDTKEFLIIYSVWPGSDRYEDEEE
ncbi:MAG: hypothetical protein IJH41_01500 [Eubacterium sp.]|nr:hypothetical protein [Eubacterium sp.]